MIPSRMYKAIATFVVNDTDYDALDAAETRTKLSSTTSVVQEGTRIRMRDILAQASDLPAIGTALGKLEAVVTAGSQPLVRAALDALNDYNEAGGLDFGHANTRLMLDGLSGSGVITTTEADMLKEFGTYTLTDLEIAGFGRDSLSEGEMERLWVDITELRA